MKLKIVITMLLAIVYTNSIYSINTVNDCNKVESNTVYQYSNNQDGTIYQFGVCKIDKQRFRYNLGTNLQGYLNSKDWNEYFRREFINSYTKYTDALNDPKYPNRLYATDYGTIIDTKGELGNDDDDDFWYDNKGNRITGKEYRTLSERKQKRYITFLANREVATYFNIIAKAIVDKDR